MGIAGNIAIIGTGKTKFGDNFEQSYFDMVVEATHEALEGARLDARDIPAAWLGTCYAYAYTTEGNAGTSLVEPLGLWDVPVTRVANYCATGMDALRNACFAVACGEYDLALVVGAEKMRDVPPRGSLVAQHVEKGHPLYCKGRTAPGMFALVANRYAATFGDVKESMAKVSVKNHHNGALNPKAHFQREVTIGQVLRAPMVAEPIGLLDCCPTTDGAAAAIITRTELAKDYTDDFVVIRGIGLATSLGYFSAQFQPDWDFLGFRATRVAAQQAYQQAGVTRPFDEIDVAEVHDCFTITEIVNYEDLGFCGPGEGMALILEGITALDGALPVNTSGGLKSYGHPIGASGLRMVVDVTEQILGRAGQRQLERSVDLGLAHTLGGPGAVSCVVIVGS